MNRYLAAGIARDAEDGRRVLVVSGSRTLARESFSAIARVTRNADRIVRANGGEAIHHRNGGRVTFTTPRSHGHRGLVADVVVFDDRTDDDPAAVASVLPCLATTQGEVIRA